LGAFPLNGKVPDPAVVVSQDGSEPLTLMSGVGNPDAATVKLKLPEAPPLKFLVPVFQCCFDRTG
jgi:hypothetical protein